MAQRDEGTGIGARAEQTFLGHGISLSGTLRLAGPARIEGDVEGEIAAADLLTIGETGVVRATIAGTTVVVHGQVSGDVTASVRLELHGTGRIEGSITAPTVAIHEGAVFHGRCTMGQAAKTALERDAAEFPPLVAVGG